MENITFNDYLSADKMVDIFNDLIDNKTRKAPYNKLRRATIKSIDHEVATITLNDSANEIDYIKIRPGLNLKVDDSVFVLGINNNTNNPLIDFKAIDLEKMFEQNAVPLQTYLIDIFQDNSGWSNSAPSTDGTLEDELVWKKFGEQSFKIIAPDNVSRTLYAKKTVSLDLDQWEDTTASVDSDYIVWIVYITDVTKINTDARLRMQTSSGNYYENIVLKANLSDGWNYIKTKKDDFTETGSPDWSNITLMRLQWDCTTNAEDEYIAITVIGMAEQLTYSNVITETSWRDELQNLIGQRIESPSSHIIQNTSEVSVTFKNNCVISDYVVMNVQLNHDWKIGTDIYPHLHWWQISSNIPNWLLEYRWQSNGSAKTTTWSRVAYASNAYTYSSGTLNQISGFGAITPPGGITLSDIVQVRLIRDINNTSTLFAGTDPETSNIDVMNFDIHLEIDSLGSRLMFIK